MLFIAAGNTGLTAEGNGWKTAELDGGKISVRYNISGQTSENGDACLLIQDTKRTIDHPDFEKCVSMMKDVSRHSEFTGDYSSEIIKRISDNEWLVYYYTKNPWPLSDSDCAARMVLTENLAEKTAVFTFTATPDAKETKKDIPRMKVSAWAVRSAFPGLPAGMIRKLAKLAGEK